MPAPVQLAPTAPTCTCHQPTSPPCAVQDVVARWDALTPQQRSDACFEGLRDAAQIVQAQPPMADGAAADAVAPAGVPAQLAAAVVAAFQAAQRQRLMQGVAALAAAGDNSAAWRAALRLMAQGDVGGEALRVRWALGMVWLLWVR